MNKSQEIKNIAAALAKAQAEFVQPEKNKTVTVRPKTAPPYSFTYADYNAIVDAIRGPLSANGIAFTHLLELRSERLMLVTKLIHGESGQELETLWPMTSSSDPKEVGGDMTYGKRYSLSAITGCVADDDADADPKSVTSFEDKKSPGTRSPDKGAPKAASFPAQGAPITGITSAGAASGPIGNGAIKMPVTPKLSPDEFILSGKLAGKKIDELGIGVLEDFVKAAGEHMIKAGLDYNTSTTDTARSYRAAKKQLATLQPGMFENGSTGIHGVEHDVS